MVKLSSDVVNKPRAPTTTAAQIIQERDAINEQRKQFVLRVTLYIVVAVTLYLLTRWVFSKILEYPLAVPEKGWADQPPTLNTSPEAVRVRHRLFTPTTVADPATEGLVTAARSGTPAYTTMAQYADRVVAAKSAAAAAQHETSLIAYTVSQPGINATELAAANAAAKSSALATSTFISVGTTILLTCLAFL